uniref:4'-phosphopantetheine phosphatase n=1 Tax=Lygus hesperus TaxID=30085 RepID=A0A0A9Y795_LYGHE
MDNLSAFQHLSDSHCLAFSIGYQTSSVTFYCKFEPKDLLNACNVLPKFKKGRIYSLKFATSELNAVLPILSKFINKSCSRETQVILTGEAARENVSNIQETLKNSLILRDYSLCLVTGFFLFLKNIRDERMTIDFLDHPKYVFVNPCVSYDQYLLVSWNGKINYFSVKSETEFEKIGHSFFDSDYLLGIARGLLDVENFDELLKLAKLSKSYIKLIYSGYEYPAEVELLKENRNILDSLDDRSYSGDRSEVAWNLLWTWLNNIGQLAAMYANLHHIDKVVFVEGSSNDSLCNDILDISFRFWSQNSSKPLFLRHEGYLSSIGALMKNLALVQQKDFNYSWEENFFLGTGMFGKEISFSGTKFMQMVLDSVGTTLTCCPLLADPETYSPDLQNIYVKDEYRAYWVRCMEGNTIKSTERMLNDTCDNIVKAMVSHYSQQMLSRLQLLKDIPFVFGNLSMRIILDTVDQCSKELGLIGIYQKIKTSESRLALGLFLERVNTLDKLPAPERHQELVTSVLIGNLFDWGSTEASALISSGKFGYKEAADTLPSRPWLYDDLDKWIERMDGPPHKKALIFVDNLGFDLIIGVLPFARELLIRGTKIILCSNREPVLNDVTHSELTKVMKQVASISTVFNEALTAGNLVLMEMSKSSCCVDLGFIDTQIAEACKDVDLLVIDGMGRGVHTNLNASFNVDSLFLSVVKDTWFASTLGGQWLSPICKYTPAM